MLDESAKYFEALLLGEMLLLTILSDTWFGNDIKQNWIRDGGDYTTCTMIMTNLYYLLSLSVENRYVGKRCILYTSRCSYSIYKT